jgi:hypothetical protein
MATFVIKGNCPFTGFAPCKQEECRFFLKEEEINNILSQHLLICKQEPGPYCLFDLIMISTLLIDKNASAFEDIVYALRKPALAPGDQKR